MTYFLLDVLFSPTMGGLYFWVSKLKPDLPVLACKYPAAASVIFSNLRRLYWLDLHNCHDFDWDFR